MSKTREDVLLVTLTDFYNTQSGKEYIHLIDSIINKSEPVSLRVLDWFVTNYSKTYREEIYVEIKLDVNNMYKNQLKAYNKSCFDPFCRISKNKKKSKKRIEFIYGDYQEKYLLTSIGQLNFFKWFFESIGMFEYLVKNLEHIKEDIREKASLLLVSREKKEVEEECVDPKTIHVSSSVCYSVSF